MQPTTSAPMQLALAQAALAMRLSNPNPRVGCVITSADGTVLGQGHTQAVGGPHAEIMALQDAQQRGHSVRGASAYVTLEPCSHHGRTGPCCDALAHAGIKNIVASIADPNPLVSGQGFQRLQAAGIAITVGDGADESRELNLGFFSRMQRKRPWVRMKIAASFDGVTALNNGVSQWITAEPARVDGHAWRARACAVLTGIGTVLQDNPRLDVRLVPSPRQPTLVIVDSTLETPTQAALFTDRPLWIYAALEDERKAAALQACGAHISYLPGVKNKVDLTTLMHDLAQREINEVHVEAGHKLNASLLKAGVVDELLVYLAPTLLGMGAGMTQLGAYTSLSQGLPLQFHSHTQVGPDLRIIARVQQPLLI